MAINFLNNIDLNKNQILNLVIQKLSTPPSSPVSGQIYYDSSTNKLKYYNGTNWIEIYNSDQIIETIANAFIDTNSVDFTYNSTNKQVQADVRLKTSLGTNEGQISVDSNGLFVVLGSGSNQAAPGNHTHTSAGITDFNEAAQDAVGNALVDTNSIDFTYDDTNNQIKADVKRKTSGLVSGSEGLINETTSGLVVSLGINDGTKAMPGNTTLNQIPAPTSDVSLNNKKITNLADPVNPTDAANKQYVDNAIQGIDAKASVRAATTANITLSGTQTIDGVSLSVGDRVLVKDQTTASQNGIYVVASGAWSRASDADTWAELVSAFVWVESGTQNGDTGWLCTVDPGGTLGTTAVTWVQFTGAGQINAGNGLSKTGNTLDVNVDNSSIEIVSDTLRVKDGGITEEKIANGAVNLATKVTGTLPISNGGTGATTAAGARANLGATGKYATTIGDGSTTNFVVNHNLGTMDVVVQIYRNSSPYDVVLTDVEITNANSVTIRFAVAPSSNQFRVVVVG
ncbi:MAG: hypothetical protein CH6_0013 [Candidatus Kapaibacterium sp.]|nr:MAG: hypothetical protein CH6_0013 [Candidatus Kapabacteria bacterium]